MCVSVCMYGVLKKGNLSLISSKSSNGIESSFFVDVGVAYDGNVFHVIGALRWFLGRECDRKTSFETFDEDMLQYCLESG